MRQRFRPVHVVWAVVTLSILLATAAPFHFDGRLHSVSAHLSRVRLNPLISPDTGRRISIPDFVQNVMLFVPFGAVAVVALRAGPRTIAAAVSLGCALSVAAESIQLVTTQRVSSLADVLANTIGTLIGAAAATMWRRAAWPGINHAAKTVAAPSYYPTLATALLACVASWEPFDPTLDVGIVAGHVKAFGASVWAVSISADHIVAMVPFLLLGFMLTQWLRELHVRFPVTVGMVAAMTAGIALEASQVFIESRVPTVANALANAAGGIAGALVAAVPMDVRSKFRVLTLVCLCAAGTATVRWIYGREGGLSAVGDVGFCMVGACLAVWSAAHYRDPPVSLLRSQ